jgi:HTH-type transcriptional regulator, bacterioopsin transcriptional activator and related proteins
MRWRRLFQSSQGHSPEQLSDEQTTHRWFRTIPMGATTLKAGERRQAAVAQLGLFALSTNDLDALMNKAVTLVAETLPVEYCKVLELLPGGKELRLRWGIGWKEEAVGHATVHSNVESQDGYTLLAQAALLSRDPVIVEDLCRETRFNGSRLLLDHGVVSGLSVAIQGPIKPFGVLGAHTAKQRRFTQEEANFVQSVADILAATIGRLEAERISRENDTRLRLLVEQIPAILWTTDAELLVTSARGAALRRLDLQPDQFIGLKLLDFFQSTPESATAHAHQRAIAGHSSDYQLIFKERIFQAYVEPLRGMADTITGCIGIAFDLTERARAEEQAGQLLIDLQDAQAKVKILRGLLPICASCKQIRDDRGYWKQIEKYISDHTDVRFSHGICPDCFQRLYPGTSPALSHKAVKST